MKTNWVKNSVIALVCILLNFGGWFLAHGCRLPIWMNTVGTCLAAYFTGTPGGIFVGVVSDVMIILQNSSSFLLLCASVPMTLLICFIVKRKNFENITTTLLSSFGLGFVCSIAYFVVRYVIYDGYTGNIWGDALFDMLKWNNGNPAFSALAGVAIVELVDKQFCLVLSYFVIKFVKKINKNQKGNRKEKTAAKTVSMLLVLCMLSSIFTMYGELPLVQAKIQEDTEYLENIYNNMNGLVSSEANVIGETKDGTIWVGSYAGLMRYDGKQFQFVRERELTSVTCLLTDHEGRLWIGTNDSGFVIFSNGVYQHYKLESGLPSNSIRCFAEDENGKMYIGTSDRICTMTEDGTIKILDYDIFFSRKMLVHNGYLVVADNAGILYAIKDNQVLTISDSSASEQMFNAIAVTKQGLMGGTESGELFILDITGSGIKITKKFSPGLSRIGTIQETKDGVIWIGSDDGLGYLDEANRFHSMKNEKFDSSFECIHEDYQGNIWIASSRYGVMKLSECRFQHQLFEQPGVEKAVVNALIKYDGDFYCGTDQGLVIFDGDTLENKNTKLTTYFQGKRIRSLLEDREHNLWACTYAEEGLVCSKKTGEIINFNRANGATSDRFRCLIQLDDGTLCCGTTDGINYIRDEKIVHKITSEDGLENSQILCLVKEEDGTILAGTDGAGIYEIKDGKIVDNFNLEKGLSSNVIMRIVPYQTGYFLVTSNSLCYMDEKHETKALGTFPYYNNYDVIIDGEYAYVPCSAGVYKINADDLSSNQCSVYELYSATDGLRDGLTANSWNYMDEEKCIYLCSNNGVVRLNTKEDLTGTDIKFGIYRMETDENVIYVDDSENRFVIDDQTKKIILYASVRNYTLFNGKVKFYLNDEEENAKLMSWEDVEPLYISALSPDENTIHLQLLDMSGTKILDEKTYTFERKTFMWEKGWFKIYLFAVCAEIVILLSWCLFVFWQYSRRKEQLEKLRMELEEKVVEQTKEIRL